MVTMTELYLVEPILSPLWWVEDWANIIYPRMPSIFDGYVNKLAMRLTDVYLGTRRILHSNLRTELEVLLASWSARSMLQI
jgi:hypothetical protein